MTFNSRVTVACVTPWDSARASNSHGWMQGEEVAGLGHISLSRGVKLKEERGDQAAAVTGNSGFVRHNLRAWETPEQPSRCVRPRGGHSWWITSRTPSREPVSPGDICSSDPWELNWQGQRRHLSCGDRHTCLVTEKRLKDRSPDSRNEAWERRELRNKVGAAREPLCGWVIAQYTRKAALWGEKSEENRLQTGRKGDGLTPVRRLGIPDCSCCPFEHSGRQWGLGSRTFPSHVLLSQVIPQSYY